MNELVNIATSRLTDDEKKKAIESVLSTRRRVIGWSLVSILFYLFQKK